MSYIFAPSETPSARIVGYAEQFPVHRIYCVGRNYAEHAREMGSDPVREPPFFFCKPADALLNSPAEMDFPSRTDDLHHEIELVVAIDKGGSQIPADQAAGHIFGYAVGLDLTRRDLQAQAKESRRPWDTAKAFDQSAPMSPITPLQKSGLISSGGIWLNVNGERRQQGDISELIWSVDEVIEELSGLFRLVPGDLIFTGTPAGVSAIKPGDRLQGGVDGLETLSLEIRK